MKDQSSIEINDAIDNDSIDENENRSFGFDIKAKKSLLSKKTSNFTGLRRNYSVSKTELEKYRKTFITNPNANDSY